MRTVVIYDSLFTNTAQVAQAIARGAGAGATATVQVLGVAEAADRLSERPDLLLVGGPTQHHGLSKGLRGFLDGLPRRSLPGVPAAVFDTRYQMSAWMSGSAARDGAARLRRAGCRLVAPPESFFMQRDLPPEGDKRRHELEGLLPGELERAQAWGAAVAALVHPETGGLGAELRSGPLTMSPARPPDPAVIRNGLAVYRVGDGQPVLLMPGPHRFQIPGDGTAGPLIEGLAGLGRQVISFDPPGSGRSTRPAALSMAEMHDCADEALAACGIGEPVDAVGHSMGGLAVLAYAVERGERVRRLVLIGTGTGARAYLSAPGALWNRGHPGFWPMAALAVLQMLWPARAPETLLNNYVHRQSFVDRQRLEQTRIRPGDWLLPRRGRTHWHRVVARHLDYAPRLTELDLPTLILCGRHDPQYPPACSEELTRGIRGSQVVWFERSGHYPFIEEHETFWATVGDFLRTPVAAGAESRPGDPCGPFDAPAGPARRGWYPPPTLGPVR
jgi:proline iminopeptidase